MTIDVWTLALQTVNVLILIWLLQKFFWRPVAAMIAQRRDAAQTMLAEAAQKHTESEAERTEIELIRAGFAKERELILATAQAEAGKLKEAGERDAAAAALVLEAAAQARIEAARRAAAAASREQAVQLAVEIAMRLTTRLDEAAVRAAFLEFLLREIAALPKSACLPDEKLELTSAAPLPAAEAREIARQIAAAFGGAPQISFTTDPALIAGLELRGKNFQFQNSWRADLGRITERLTHDAGN
jgi:F-type H+-transporting ATPase subunit b